MCKYVDNSPPLGMRAKTMSYKLSPGSGTTCPGQVSSVLWVLIPSHGHHRQAESKDLLSFYLFTCQAFNEHLLCAWLVPLADEHRDLRRWIYQEAKGQTVPVLNECGNVYGGRG